MPNGNRNSAGWKSKLDELESLPGEMMPDKNAAWDKLHSRLATRRNNNKKAAWYWAAAACILFAVTIPMFVSNNKEGQLTGTAIKENQPAVKSPVATLIEKDGKDIVPVKNNEVVSVLAKNNNKINSKIIPQGIRNEIRLYDTVSSHGLVKENVNIISQPTDTLSNVASALPVKKKLKVVHINELGDPVEMSPDIAGKKDLHSFQLKLARQEVYTSPSVAFDKNGFTIFKTKSSPN
jgi:hypothetical protein